MAKVYTIHGEVEESELVKRTGFSDDGAAWVEYYRDGELVHRSVAVELTGNEAVGAAATFG